MTRTRTSVFASSFFAAALLPGGGKLDSCEWRPREPPAEEPCEGGGGATGTGGLDEGGAGGALAHGGAGGAPAQGGAGEGGDGDGGACGGGGAGGGVVEPVVRPALAVIVDFEDAKFEDWTGPGINDVVSLHDHLEAMEEHWRFLSRGEELMDWDVIRIMIPLPLTEDAYPGWMEFRDDVALAVRDEIDVDHYDVDGDGIVDTMWAIVTTTGTDAGFMVGGAWRNRGVNNFVDAQDSDSFVAGAIGNFNHEAGHTRDLPDMYGPYSNLSDLTLMAGSWPLPANDFAAYDRVRIGWVEPRIVDETTECLELYDAHTHESVIKVPTTRPDEYFLLEYRRRPESGFGSRMHFDVDGIAVYHVLEGSAQWIDPPLVKLEPADGVRSPTLEPEADDFASPDDPSTLDPFVLHTYFGGDPVFQIENVRAIPGGDGLAFDLVMLGGTLDEPNLLENGTFEEGTDGWSTVVMSPGDVTFDWADIGANGSAHSAHIATASFNDAWFFSAPIDVDPALPHQICGHLRGADVAGGFGATVGVHWSYRQSRDLFGTFDFTRVCVTAPPEADGTLEVACRLGNFNNESTGEVWCDDVTVTPVLPVFDPPSAAGLDAQQGVDGLTAP